MLQQGEDFDENFDGEGGGADEAEAAAE